ncbi:hypothetical protein [Streptomyces sp. NPDC087856]
MPVATVARGSGAGHCLSVPSAGQSCRAAYADGVSVCAALRGDELL